MMKAFFQFSYARYILLSIGMVIAVFTGYSIVFHHKLSNAEIDQLEMQSTFGQDDASLLRLKKAADHGQIEAKMAVGKSYLFKHQYPLAIAYLDSAAQQGNVEAATTLGKIYFQGDDRLTKNPELALKYFNQAYAQQDPSAAYYLGLIYKNGYGLKADIVKANQYFQFAADHQIANIAVVKTVTIDDPEMTSTIINNVIKNQSTTVDTVSGATVTSKAYLKSIENALTQ